MRIEKNIDLIRAKVASSALKVRRNPDDVTLLGVSKQITKELITEAYNAGLLHFGENYAQEFRDKYAHLNQRFSDIRWHFIGHLQRNKIKYIVGKADIIHSVNSLGLAEEINGRSEKLGVNTSILIEINSSGERTKTGMSFTDAEKLINRINDLKNIVFKGVMTMAPYNNDPELSRPYFRKLRLFSNEVIKDHPGASEVSMGMSGDFEVAVEEGATIVRIGSAIFGNRNS